MGNDSLADLFARLQQAKAEAELKLLADRREGWFVVLREHLGDESLARTIQLIGDGLYFDDTTGLAEKNALQHVRDVLQRLGAL